MPGVMEREAMPVEEGAHDVTHEGVEEACENLATKVCHEPSPPACECCRPVCDIEPKVMLCEAVLPERYMAPSIGEMPIVHG